uniref:Gastrula zinc finger protein XlCGF57.1 n=1 Tax=Culex pipiens TaxID=7175 RepID=A0A8D8F4V0_CULPI
MTHRFSRMKMASTTAPSATIRLLNQTCLEVMSVAIGRLRLACTRARCVKWLVKSAFTSICCYLILLFLSQRFPNKDHLFYHKKTHLKERFECLTCHEKFATKKDLFKHRLIHTKNVITKQFMEKVTEDEKGVFTCSICGNTHTERKYAISHFRKHVTEKFMCQICEKRCGSRRDLVQHIESQHEKLRFRCSTCKERFETRTALLEHKQMHKSDSKKIRRIDDRYHCTRCDKTYSRRENALNHFKSHGSKEEDAAQSTDSVR